MSQTKSRAFWSLVLMAGFAELGYATLNISAMPVYLRDSLGFGEATVTRVGAVFLLTEALLRAPMGLLSDHIGRRRLMIIGPFVTIWTAVCTLFVPQLFETKGLQELAYIALRGLDGIGAAMLWPAAFAAIGDCVEEKDRASAMSFLNFTYMFGIALGPLAGGLANDLTGAKTASFYLVAVLFAATVVINYLFYPRDHKSIPAHHEEASQFQIRALASAVKLVPGYLLLAFVVFLGTGLIMLLVKLFAMDEYGMSETQFGTLLLLPAIIMAILALPIGRWADKMGRVRAVRLGLWAGSIAMWAIATQSNKFIVMTAAGVAAVSFLLAIPAWLAELSEIDPKQRGVILGAAGTAQGLGSIVGALLGGILYEKVPLQFWIWDYPAHRTPFIGCALMMTLGATLSLLVIRVRRAKEER